MNLLNCPVRDLPSKGGRFSKLKAARTRVITEWKATEGYEDITLDQVINRYKAGTINWEFEREGPKNEILSFILNNAEITFKEK